MCMIGLCICVCTMCMPGTRRIEQSALISLELELWRVVNHHRGAGNQTLVPLQEQQVCSTAKPSPHHLVWHFHFSSWLLLSFLSFSFSVSHSAQTGFRITQSLPSLPSAEAASVNPHLSGMFSGFTPSRLPPPFPFPLNTSA